MTYAKLSSCFSFTADEPPPPNIGIHFGHIFLDLSFRNCIKMKTSGIAVLLPLLLSSVSALPSIESSAISRSRGGHGNIEKRSVGTKTSPLTEALSGATVALASIPSSIAYSAIAGVSPLVGVWSSVILGAVSAVTGMRPGLVPGCAGVVAVPLAAIIAQSPQYIAPTILMASAIELIFALLRGGQLIALVSDAVMNGFLNGLGLLLLKSQLKTFFKAGKFIPTPELISALGITTMTAALALSLPKVLPKTFPTALLAIVASTAFAQVMNLPVARLSLGGDITSWKSTLPSFIGLPKFNLTILKIIAPAALSIALISILETLLCVKVVDDATDTTVPGALDKSCQAMALGNAASALFGGFGGCGLIPQTLLNISSGGTGVTSVLAYAGVMAAGIVFTSSLIKMVPIASFAGIMLLVASRTFQTKSSIDTMVAFLKKKSPTKKLVHQSTVDVIALFATTFLCFKVDMGIGIIAGVLLDKVLSKI
jgi:sulfate permease, SulP family